MGPTELSGVEGLGPTTTTQCAMRPTAQRFHSALTTAAPPPFLTLHSAAACPTNKAAGYRLATTQLPPGYRLATIGNQAVAAPHYL